MVQNDTYYEAWLSRVLENEPYKGWISRVEPSEAALSAMRLRLAGFEHLPRVSILLIASDLDEIWLKRSVASVLSQLYPHVELCVCDNASRRHHVKAVLEELAASDDRVKVSYLQDPGSRARAYNRALSLATGEFVTFLGQGDELEPTALFRVVELLQQVRADVIYTDEDLMDISDTRSNPTFKPHWSPDLLLSSAYIGDLVVIRREIVSSLGGFRESPECPEGAEEHDLLLRISEKTGRFRHLPWVLYHRRSYEENPTHAGPGQEVLRRVAKDALERASAPAEVRPGLTPDSIQVIRHLSEEPTVSLVALASEDGWAERIRELTRDTSYPLHQVITAEIVEGRPSGEASISSAFPAKAANIAASKAVGEYLVFVTDSARPVSSEWLTWLVREARRPGVGMVGGKVLSQDGDLLHAGSFLNLDVLAGLSLNPVPEQSPRLLPVVDYPFNPCAVPIEGMVIRRSAFEEAGGFDEDNLPKAFYDVDFSFRIGEKGLLNVYTPYATLVSGGVGHAPSGAEVIEEHTWTRGGVEQIPSEEEIEYMWFRWWSALVKLFHYTNPPLHGAYEDVYAETLGLVSIQ